jgi:hypothetical protein
MTLEKTLRQQLNSPEQGGFHVTADGWSVTLVADKADTLSCALRELTLERAGAVREELRAWSERVAATATGLIEPLAVLEIDIPLGKALLRSETPTLKDGKAYYYELLLARGDRSSAHLTRYAGDRFGSGKRESVPFVLTHDAIVKLVNDIAGAN